MTVMAALLHRPSPIAISLTMLIAGVGFMGCGTDTVVIPPGDSGVVSTEGGSKLMDAGSESDAAHGSQVDGCTPDDTADCAGKCGHVVGRCGGVVDCGGCAAGQTCGANGMSNVCGVGPCTPACGGKACGADDGCGGTCASGSCSAGLVCSGGSCVCNATSGCAGCCANGACLPGTNDMACGMGGLACQTCPAGQEGCTSGACTTVPVVSACSLASVPCSTTCAAVGRTCVDKCGPNMTAIGQVFTDSACTMPYTWFGNGTTPCDAAVPTSTGAIECCCL
jgi:hypothetical protein